MRHNLGIKTLLYPQPVLIIGTYDENGNPNAMNAAWGGISEEDQVTVCVDSRHKTTENLLSSGAFTLSIGTKSEVIACDYVGIVSGKTENNKFEKAGWKAIKSEFVNAPIIDKLPLCLECSVISYDKDSCQLKGKIINVSADESILKHDNKIDVGKLSPISFDPDNLQYLVIGESIAKAFNIGKEIK